MLMQKQKMRVSRGLFTRALFVAGLLSNVLTPASFANVVGNDAQNFNPTTSGLDFVTVHSSETLEPGIFNLGLFLNHATNTLPYTTETDAAGRQSRVRINDTVTGADLNIGMGIMRNWDLGISLPQVLDQSVKSDDPHAQFGSTGNTEIRVNTKYRLIGDSSEGVALVASTNLNRIRNNPYIGDGGGNTYNLEVAADTTINKFALGGNIGYRWRHPGEKLPDFPFEPLRNQVIGSMAASYHLSEYDTKIIGEIFGSRPAASVSFDSDRQQSSAEALVGLKHDVAHNVSINEGFGTGLIRGYASPDWRVYAGVNVMTGPMFGQDETSRVESGSSSTTLAHIEDLFKGPIKKGEERVVVHDSILFQFDSDKILNRAEADLTLRRLAEYLNTPPKFTKMTIEGHTCSLGDYKYNIDLSRRRAQAIRKVLVEKYHVEAQKVDAVGFGPAKPIGDNGNYQGRILNRRVEFKIFRQ